MGTSHACTPNICFILNARLSAVDFFDGIEVFSSSAGREYRKGTQVIREFPSTMRVLILSWPLKTEKVGAVSPESAKIALESLVLRAEWKTGLTTRSVAKLDVSIRQMSAQEWRLRPETKTLEDLGIEPSDPSAKGIWIVEATIQDEHVPITDSLVVTIASGDGNYLARFSARV
jgi:hypothetical protein